MLSANNIQVAFGRTTILDDVSLTVAPGEVVAMLGPNGAGKSTFLAVLSGALAPTAGEIVLAGRPLDEWSTRVLARQRAVLSQHSELSFPFRVLEVVLLGRSPYAGSVSREDDLIAAYGALKETETVHLADRLYPTLSGGEKQRVQLARILAQIDFAKQNGDSERYLSFSTNLHRASILRTSTPRWMPSAGLQSGGSASLRFYMT